MLLLLFFMAMAMITHFASLLSSLHVGVDSKVRILNVAKFTSFQPKLCKCIMKCSPFPHYNTTNWHGMNPQEQVTWLPNMPKLPQEMHSMLY